MHNDLYSKIERELLSPRSLLTVGVICILLLIILLVSTNTQDRSRVDPIRQPVATTENPFADITLEAQSAIVWDVTNNRAIFAQSSTSTRPLASLTKLVMAIAAAETIPSYTVVPIRADALAQEGDTGLFLNERWSAEKLITTSLISSSNDGARAIASVAGAVLTDHSPDTADTPNALSTHEQFVHAMNQLTQRAGMTQSYFNNEHGLDVSAEESGGYGSAEDVARLLTYAWNHHGDVLSSTAARSITTQSIDGISHTVTNTNPVVDNVPGILASKTGYTELAGGNVAILMSPGLEGPFAIVVLGSTYDGRFTDLLQLSNATLEYVVKNY